MPRRTITLALFPARIAHRLYNQQLVNYLLRWKDRYTSVYIYRPSNRSRRSRPALRNMQMVGNGFFQLCARLHLFLRICGRRCVAYVDTGVCYGIFVYYLRRDSEECENDAAKVFSREIERWFMWIRTICISIGGDENTREILRHLVPRSSEKNIATFCCLENALSPNRSQMNYCTLSFIFILYKLNNSISINIWWSKVPYTTVDAHLFIYHI